MVMRVYWCGLTRAPFFFSPTGILEAREREKSRRERNLQQQLRKLKQSLLLTLKYFLYLTCHKIDTVLSIIFTYLGVFSID